MQKCDESFNIRTAKNVCIYRWEIKNSFQSLSACASRSSGVFGGAVAASAAAAAAAKTK